MWVSSAILHDAGLFVNKNEMMLSSHVRTVMDAVGVAFLALTLFSVFCGNSAYENASSKETSTACSTCSDLKNESNTRSSRTLLKKLHSGVAFLTGVKLGTLLSNKGAFDLGHGSLSSSHSFQLFGKSINSALSLSYGDIAPILPLVDDVSQNFTYRIGEENSKGEENIIHVTVIENPSVETFEKLKAISPIRAAGTDDLKIVSAGENISEIPELYQDNNQTETIQAKASSNFLVEHNKRVQQLNDLVKRPNSKF